MQSLPDAFWETVSGSGEGECWITKYAPIKNGYVSLSVGGKKVYAHRLSYEHHIGPIPTGYDIDHMCWTRSCVNPAHLRAVTRGENLQNFGRLRTDNTSGVRGVCWHKGAKKWMARGHLNGKGIYIGVFDQLKDAEREAIAWRREHMPFSIQDQANA